MLSLADSTGLERAERLQDAIGQERQAVEKMSEAIESQREAVAGRHDDE